MTNTERKTVDQIKKGDRYESQWSEKVFEIEYVIDGGKFVVYKKPSSAGYAVTEGTTFLRSDDYKLIAPFFEKGKTYAYKTTYGSLGNDRYTIIAINEFNGKKIATYVEASSSGDEWFGTLTEGDFARYGNEVSA